MLSRSPLLHADLSESPSPGHVAAPAAPQPLALHKNYTYDPPTSGSWPLISHRWRLQTWPGGRAGVSLEKRHILQEPCTLRNTDTKRKAEEELRHIRPYGVFSLRTGISHLQPICQKWAWRKNSMTVFTPPEGPVLLHMYSILHSTHPPSDLKGEGVSKGWNWPRKQDWSLLSDVRLLKINKEGKIKGGTVIVAHGPGTHSRPH